MFLKKPFLFTLFAASGCQAEDRHWCWSSLRCFVALRAWTGAVWGEWCVRELQHRWSDGQPGPRADWVLELSQIRIILKLSSNNPGIGQTWAEAAFLNWFSVMKPSLDKLFVTITSNRHLLTPLNAQNIINAQTVSNRRAPYCVLDILSWGCHEANRGACIFRP